MFGVFPSSCPWYGQEVWWVLSVHRPTLSVCVGLEMFNPTHCVLTLVQRRKSRPGWPEEAGFPVLALPFTFCETKRMWPCLFELCFLSFLGCLQLCFFTFLPLITHCLLRSARIILLPFCLFRLSLPACGLWLSAVWLSPLPPWFYLALLTPLAMPFFPALGRYLGC